jgi:predicted dinucleotide-utilizing enzyme
MDQSQNKIKCKIGIVGYGVFGSKLITWLGSHASGVQILYVIEINRHKRDILKKLGYFTYESIYDVPEHLLNETNVVVDCSSRGQGVLNKEHYKLLKLSAIFQNGEESLGVGKLYYPGLVELDKTIPQYVKIPLCSGIAAIKVINVIQSLGLADVLYASGYHMKVTNTARMLTMNYQQSNEEMEQLLNVKARMNVIYMRGEPYNGLFSYHGALNVKLDKSIDLDEFFRRVEQTPYLHCENQDIDCMFYSGTEDTVIIRESVCIKDNVISLSTMSFTPEVNFPINLEAIRELCK